MGSLNRLLTHPQTEERIQTLKAYSQEYSGRTMRLLPDSDWQLMHTICEHQADAS
jgi:predicted Zn-dependent protease